MELTKDKLEALFRKMLLVRALEEKHDALLKEGRMQLMAHTGLGQEAVAIGVTGPLRKEDILFGTHRGVGEYIGKGMTAKDIFAEFMGKKTGLCKGKGTLHLADRSVNIPPLVASLGSDFGMAVGTALASKMKKTDHVTMYYVGEGACNEGDFNPALCMAALWKLPVVFAIAANQFCQRAYMTEHLPTPDVAPRAAGYNIPYEIIDGQDIEVTYSATEKIVEQVRAGNGPFVIEYKTFRMGPHSSGDRGGYVRQEDVEEWAKRDPIDLCQRKLVDRGYMSVDDIDRVKIEVDKEIEQAVEYAFASPDPTADDFIEDVYAHEGAR